MTQSLLLLEVEVVLCVFVADALDYLFKSFVVLGVFAVLYPTADEVAEYASEILVARIGNEAAAVGEHSNES